MSRNLLQEDDDDDREKTYDDAPPRRFRFMLHHFRRRRVFVIIAVVLIIAIVIVAAVPKGHKKNEPKPPPIDPSRQNYDDFRLPSWVIPQHYDLHLNTSFAALIFSGHVDITLSITNSSKNLIVIHAVDLDLDKSTITLRQQGQTTPNKLSSWTQSANTSGLDYYLLYFDSLLTPHDGTNSYILSINFTGSLSDTLAGYYLSSYLNAANETKYLATTQFEPIYARRAFPCFDEPGLKATFSISMHVEPDYFAISNMNSTVVVNPDKTKDYTFAQSPRMSTYLVCYIVSQFSSSTSGGTTISIYSTPDSMSQTNYALNTTVKALQAFNNYFGISYPLPKLDVVAIPDFAAGAMENWGIITFRVNALLFDEATGSASERMRVADVIVHELAHQWFGNYVTMEWWNDIFLNEGFATFMEFIILPQIEPTWNFDLQFQIDVRQSALSADSYITAHPISNNASTGTQIEAYFDPISYDKGASVLRMLMSVVDNAYKPNEFQNTITSYLQKFNYSNADAQDLWACFDSSVVNVPKLMDSWITQAGFPYITVTKPNATAVTFTQTRFLQAQPGSSNSTVSPSNQKWWIFINAIDSKGTIHNHWNITQSSETVEYNWANGYLLLNADATGFYRTLYNLSDDIMQTMYNDLNPANKKLSNVQRSAIYDDVFAFWKASLLNASQVLSLTSRLQNENDYLVWNTALSGLTYAYRKLIIGAAPCVSAYQGFVQGLLSKTIASLNWTEPNVDTDLVDGLMLSMMLGTAVSYEDSQVMKTAVEFWDNGTTINPNIRNTVLRSVVIASHNNQSRFDSVINMYKQSNVSQVKVSCLQALAYAPRPWQQKQALNFALSSDVKSQDAYIVFVNMAIYNPSCLSMIWQVFRENITLFNKGGRLADFKDDVISAIAASSSGYDYESMKEFLVNNKLDAEPVGAQALESIQINQQWINANANDVCAWLAKLPPAPVPTPMPTPKPTPAPTPVPACPTPAPTIVPCTGDLIYTCAPECNGGKTLICE